MKVHHVWVWVTCYTFDIRKLRLIPRVSQLNLWEKQYIWKKHLGKNIIEPKRETGLNLITIMALNGYRAQWNCTDRQLYWLSKKKMWSLYTYMCYYKITSVKPRFLQRLLDKVRMTGFNWLTSENASWIYTK